MQRDWLMGWAPLAHIFADGLPARPALRSPDPLRFTDAEQAARRVLDVPVAEPACDAKPFKIGDRVLTFGRHRGTVMAVDEDNTAFVAFDAGDWRLDERGWAPIAVCALELIPSPESKPTTASDGEWKTQPPTEPGWYLAESVSERYTCVLARHWNGAAWTNPVCTIAPNAELFKSALYCVRDASISSFILWLRRCTAAELGE